MPTCRHVNKMTTFCHLDVVRLIQQCYISTQVLNLWIFWKNACQYLVFSNFTIYKPKCWHVAKMPSFWHLNVIRLICQYFICISILYLWLLIKKTCQYLYFKMLLYISQNAAMWTKLRHCGILLSSHWF